MEYIFLRYEFGLSVLCNLISSVQVWYRDIFCIACLCRLHSWRLTTTLSQRGSEIQEPANERKSEYSEVNTYIHSVRNSIRINRVLTDWDWKREVNWSVGARTFLFAVTSRTILGFATIPAKVPETYPQGQGTQKVWLATSLHLMPRIRIRNCRTTLQYLLMMWYFACVEPSFCDIWWTADWNRSLIVTFVNYIGDKILNNTKWTLSIVRDWRSNIS